MPKCSKLFGKSMSMECKNRIQVAWLISNLKHLGLFPWAVEPFAMFSSRLSLLLLLTSKFQSVWLRMQANYNYGSNTIMVYHLRRYPSDPSLPFPLFLSLSLLLQQNGNTKEICMGTFKQADRIQDTLHLF